MVRYCYQLDYKLQISPPIFISVIAPCEFEHSVGGDGRKLTNPGDI